MPGLPRRRRGAALQGAALLRQPQHAQGFEAARQIRRRAGHWRRCELPDRCLHQLDRLCARVEILFEPCVDRGELLAEIENLEMPSPNIVAGLIIAFTEEVRERLLS